jgi:hypothetical protein
MPRSSGPPSLVPGVVAYNGMPRWGSGVGVDESGGCEGPRGEATISSGGDSRAGAAARDRPRPPVRVSVSGPGHRGCGAARRTQRRCVRGGSPPTGCARLRRVRSCFRPDEVVPGRAAGPGQEPHRSRLPCPRPAVSAPTWTLRAGRGAHGGWASRSVPQDGGYPVGAGQARGRCVVHCRRGAGSPPRRGPVAPPQPGASPSRISGPASRVVRRSGASVDRNRSSTRPCWAAADISAGSLLVRPVPCNSRYAVAAAVS